MTACEKEREPEREVYYLLSNLYRAVAVLVVVVAVVYTIHPPVMARKRQEKRKLSAWDFVHSCVLLP